MKYKLMRGLILGVAISASSPTIAMASEDGLKTSLSSFWDSVTSDENKEKAKEVGKDIFNGLVDFSSEVDEKINEKIIDPLKDKTAETNLFKKDSLWLIEKVGDLEEDEKRFFFVNKNIPTIRKNYYYDCFGNTVKKDTLEVVAKKSKEMFVAVNDVGGEAFLKIIYEDLANQKVYVNFQDMVDGELVFSVPNASLGEFDKQYIRYQDWTKMFDLSDDEKISIDELNSCLELLEQNYKEQNANLVRRKD